MKDFLNAIAYLFEDILLVPLDTLRELELENWFAANTLNWVFMAITFVAFVYWMKQLKEFDRKGDDRKDVTAHRILGKNAEL
ncbi:MAG: DUF6341 family protein [Mesonia hippocampi]|uniref:DUF6341 family protein n=1 Tax=Mesonia hippocampi TaxID=1628250 RepID=UPI003F9D03B1